MTRQRRVRESAAQNNEENYRPNLAGLVGDRWTLLILIAAFFATRRYDDFLKQLNIAPGILVERLKNLIKAEVFVRHSYQENPPRYEYRLTTNGKSLYPFIMGLQQWIVDWLPQDAPRPNLTHKSCGEPLIVEIHCQACGEKPWPRDVRLKI